MNNPASPRHALGRGLESILKPIASGAAVAAVAAPASPTDAVQQVAISQIRPNPKQPRQNFDAAALQELAASIKVHGIIQPLLARRVGADAYELIAGERRFRAAELAGLTTVPLLVRAANEEKSLEWAIIENLQREDLNPLEQARAFRQLAGQFGLSQEQIAEKTGKDRSSVANFMRLLKLEPEVQMLLEDGKLSMGHARALLAVEGDRQKELATKVVERGLSVRQIEELVSLMAHPKLAAEPKPRDPNVREAEERLAQLLGTKVRIRDRKKNSGTIEIEYFGLDQFQRIFDLFAR